MDIILKTEALTKRYNKRNAIVNVDIREIFINNQTMAAVAREQGIPFDRIRQIKEKGLRKLRTGRARRELLEKFDIVEAGAYRNSMSKFNEHGFYRC